MTKILSAKYKVSRRLGVSIWGSENDPFHKKNYRPGQHGHTPSMNKPSDYGLHLKAKQRIKAHYGRINERQFRNIFKLAQKMKGNTGENFIGLLESRIDAIVYRMGFASTIFGARQLVTHGHICVNGKKVDIPSCRLKIGDVVTLKDSSKQIPVIVESLAKAARSVPEYLDFDKDAASGKFTRVPGTAEVPYPFEPEVHFVVEFYSR